MTSPTQIAAELVGLLEAAYAGRDVRPAMTARTDQAARAVADAEAGLLTADEQAALAVELDLLTLAQAALDRPEPARLTAAAAAIEAAGPYADEVLSLTGRERREALAHLHASVVAL